MKRAMARGAAWMLLFKVAERSLSFVSVIVLARLLLPADFGLVAMAISVIAFVELAAAFGFDAALIQRQEPTRDHYDTAWTLQVGAGAFCAALTAALAIPTATFYAEPRLVGVMLVLAAGLLVQGFENIGVVEFRRRMDFAKEFRFLSAKRVAGFLVTMVIAFSTRSYWALIVGTLAGRVTGVIVSYILQPYRPRFSLVSRRDLFAFSSWMFGANVFAFASRRTSHFVIGRLYGPAALGLFTVGSEIAHLPSTDILAPMSRAIFPGYARMAADPPRLRQGFLDVIGALWVLGFPACFGIAAVADPLVHTLLGDQWSDAVIVVQILAIAGAGHVMTSNHFSAWLALGRTRTTALCEAFHMFVLIGMLFALSRGGLAAIAYAELGAMVASITLECYLLCRAMSFSLRVYLSGLWRPVGAAALMALAVYVLLESLKSSGYVESHIVRLAVGCAAGTVLYVALLAIGWLIAGKPQSAEALLFERAVEVVQSKRLVFSKLAFWRL